MNLSLTKILHGPKEAVVSRLPRPPPLVQIAEHESALVNLHRLLIFNATMEKAMTIELDEILDPNDPRMQEMVRIWGDHDLVENACEPIGGMVVVLTEAANALQQQAMTIFKDQAVAPDVAKSIKQAATMVQDALVLGTMSLQVPSPGIVEPYETEDGATGYFRRAAEG